MLMNERNLRYTSIWALMLLMSDRNLRYTSIWALMLLMSDRTTLYDKNMVALQANELTANLTLLLLFKSLPCYSAAKGMFCTRKRDPAEYQRDPFLLF
jgi:hypothetical protein